MKLIRIFDNLMRRIFRPLPGVLTVLLGMTVVAVATAALPYFASGTAQFGPGGLVDLGSVDGGNTGASADPQMYNGSGGNVVLQVPNGQYVNMKNCTNSGCSTTQLTLQVGTTALNALAPVLTVPYPVGTGVVFSPTPGPVPPCYVPNGTPCQVSMHAVYGNISPTVTGTCNANSICNIRSSGCCSPTLAGNANFDIPAGQWNVACSASGAANGLLVSVGYVSAQNQIEAVQFYNANSTAIADGTGLSVGFYCTGQ